MPGPLKLATLKPDAAEAMRFLIEQEKLPQPKLELRVNTERRWRFDLAWPDHKVALEIEGGTGYGPMRSKTGKAIVGHHAHPKGYESDCEKYNAAQLAGWLVLRATRRMVYDGRALKALKEALRGL